MKRGARALAAVLLLLSACEPKKDLAPPPAEKKTAAGASAAKVAAAPSFDLLRNVRVCDVKHRGLLLDVGSRGVDAHREYAVGPLDDVPAEERGGATFGRVLAKRVGYQFWLDDEEKAVAVSVRASGALARRASLYLDDRRLGTLSLSPDEVRVLTLKATEPLARGPHTVVLRFIGAQRTPDEPYAFVDWIRIGVPEEHPEEYAAPTLRQLVTDVVIDERPRRAMVLRSPGTVRCALRVVPGAHLEASVGYWGNGSGVAEVRVVEDGEQPVVLREIRVTGGEGKTWTPLSLSLEPFAGRVVGVELRGVESSGGGRVAFGEPRVVVNRPVPPRVPAAKVAVVVVGAGLDRRLVPPWGPAEGLTALSGLARDGVVFDWHRVPTTVSAGVLASLVTGLSPRAHALEDALARLPNEVRAIGQLVKESGGRAAMFTGVPMSFPAFGFDKGWDDYEWFSPVRDVAATEPLVRATTWLKQQLDRDANAKLFVLVHVRGGHPPWDLTRDEAQQLPPDEYGGPIEPRRGASVLSAIRQRRARSERKLSNADWTRLRALEAAAFKKQNSALRGLFEMLERRGIYDGALIAFLGDVATGDAPHLPFAPAPELSEEHLVAPLIVKFPGRGRAGARVGALVTTTDVTRTVLEALGAAEGAPAGSIDLFQSAAGFEPADGRPHSATLGSSFATRWGPWLLRGEVRKTPVLCQFEVDPACAHDQLTTSPIAAQALWRQTFEAEGASRALTSRVFQRESAVLDPETQAALTVFGYGG